MKKFKKPIAAVSFAAIILLVVVLNITVFPRIVSNEHTEIISTRDESIDVGKSNSALNTVMSEEKAVNCAIKGIEHKLETERIVKGINENRGYADEYEITRNIDFYSLPYVAKYVNTNEAFDTPMWVIVFQNGQRDVIYRFSDEISIDQISDMAIELGHVWTDCTGSIFCEIDEEVYYYIIEVNAVTGEMIDYRSFYSWNNDGEPEEQGGETIDDFLAAKYNMQFNAKYHPPKSAELYKAEIRPVMDELNKAVEFIGTKKAAEDEFGALSKFCKDKSIYNDSDSVTGTYKVLSVVLGKDKGNIWVEYSQKTYDKNGEFLSGISEAKANITVKKVGDNWLAESVCMQQ